MKELNGVVISIEVILNLDLLTECSLKNEQE